MGIVYICTFLNIIISWAIIFFTFSLIWLHVKLYKNGITAYEYIVYQDEKQERLIKLKAGLITQEQYDEEEEKVKLDMRK